MSDLKTEVGWEIRQGIDLNCTADHIIWCITNLYPQWTCHLENCGYHHHHWQIGITVTCHVTLHVVPSPNPSIARLTRQYFNVYEGADKSFTLVQHNDDIQLFVTDWQTAWKSNRESRHVESYKRPSMKLRGEGINKTIFFYINLLTIFQASTRSLNTQDS